MSFLKSAGAIGPVWGSHTQVLQLLQGPLLPLPSTSSVALLSVLGISQAFILMLLLSLDVPTSTTMTFFLCLSTINGAIVAQELAVHLVIGRLPV